MVTKPCVVCEYPVEVEDIERKEIFVAEDKPIRVDEVPVKLYVCANPRCVRLVHEALAEENRKQVL